MEDEPLVYCVPCSKRGVQTVLIKDENWLPCQYNNKPRPGHTCRECRNTQNKQAHRKRNGYKGQQQRSHTGIFERRQRESVLGGHLCSECWHGGVETLLVKDVTWFPCDYNHKPHPIHTCMFCERKRVERSNRKRGIMPAKADRSLLNDYYCYALIDEHDSTYYIGMGRGDRVNAHLKDTQAKLAGRRRGKRGMLLYTEKEKRIIRCLDSSAGYRYVKLATGLTQAQAFDAEAFWIDVYGEENLTNIAKPRARGKPPIPAFSIR